MRRRFQHHAEHDLDPEEKGGEAAGVPRMMIVLPRKPFRRPVIALSVLIAVDIAVNLWSRYPSYDTAAATITHFGMYTHRLKRR